MSGTRAHGGPWSVSTMTTSTANSTRAMSRGRDDQYPVPTASRAQAARILPPSCRAGRVSIHPSAPSNAHSTAWSTWRPWSPARFSSPRYRTEANQDSTTQGRPWAVKV